MAESKNWGCDVSNRPAPIFSIKAADRQPSSLKEFHSDTLCSDLNFQREREKKKSDLKDHREQEEKPKAIDDP